MFGIKSRTTKDMDTTIRGIDVSKDKMLKILNDILSIDLHDGVKFEIVKVADIRQNDEYGGNKYYVVGKFENLKINLEIDISTGDKITPRKLRFEYISIFENKKIFIYSYNIETILAEKIETILRRGQYNARMKDYYDVYFFLSNLKNEINIKTTRDAIYNTAIKRDTVNMIKDYNNILDEILDYKRINTYWNNYIEKNKYAENIRFKDIIECLREFLQRIININN